jgi:hypothetical protein
MTSEDVLKLDSCNDYVLVIGCGRTATLPKTFARNVCRTQTIFSLIINLSVMAIDHGTQLGRHRQISDLRAQQDISQDACAPLSLSRGIGFWEGTLQIQSKKSGHPPIFHPCKTWVTISMPSSCNKSFSSASWISHHCRILTPWMDNCVAITRKNLENTRQLVGPGNRKARLEQLRGSNDRERRACLGGFPMEAETTQRNGPPREDGIRFSGVDVHTCEDMEACFIV